MNITRENFDEICMLYADNELSAEERALVEAFVAANPDLRADLELYCSLKLEADASIGFGDTSSLHRSEAGIPAVSEEALLLLLDGELEETEKQVLESRIASDEQLGRDWAILQNTRLDATEQVIYPDKAGLYRHASARVIRFTWVRYAAAAAIILAAGLLWLNRPDNTDGSGSNTMARVTPSGETRPETGNAGQQTGESVADIPAVKEELAAPSGPDNQAPLASLADAAKGNKATASPAGKTTGQGQPTPVSGKPAPAADPLVARVDPVPSTTATVPENTAVTAPTDIALGNRPVVDITDKAVGEQTFKSDYATQALSASPDETEAIQTSMDDSNRSRKGLRGFVRKANRIFHKVTNPDLDKPLVKTTNFQIGLGR